MCPRLGAPGWRTGLAWVFPHCGTRSQTAEGGTRWGSAEFANYLPDVSLSKGRVQDHSPATPSQDQPYGPGTDTSAHATPPAIAPGSAPDFSAVLSTAGHAFSSKHPFSLDSAQAPSHLSGHFFLVSQETLTSFSHF